MPFNLIPSNHWTRFRIHQNRNGGKPKMGRIEAESTHGGLSVIDMRQENVR